MILLYCCFGILITYSQSVEIECEGLLHGSFETYEEGLKIGTFFRKGDIQIEKYFKDSTFSLARIRSKECVFYINSYEIKRQIDTITWIVKYQKISDTKYSYLIEPAFLDNGISFKGHTIKISDSIDNEAFIIFESLEGNIPKSDF